jgi:hypothetical protein
VDINEPWDFDSPNWEHSLVNLVSKQGTLSFKSAIDYFVFSRDLLTEIPPFAIGRTAWDNWLIFRGRERSAMVVDATACVMAVHQSHGYENFDSLQSLSKGAEGRQNRKLMADGNYTLDDVTHILQCDGLRSAWTLGELLRHPSRLAARYPALRRPMKSLAIVKLSRPLRSALGLTRQPQRMRKP